MVSHDLKTVPGYAHERIAAGLPMPGVFLLRATVGIAVAIDEIALIAEASDAADWAGKVVYLPSAECGRGCRLVGPEISQV